MQSRARKSDSPTLRAHDWAVRVGCTYDTRPLVVPHACGVCIEMAAGRLVLLAAYAEARTTGLEAGRGLAQKEAPGGLVVDRCCEVATAGKVSVEGTAEAGDRCGSLRWYEVGGVLERRRAVSWSPWRRTGGHAIEKTGGSITSRASQGFDKLVGTRARD